MGADEQDLDKIALDKKKTLDQKGLDKKVWAKYSLLGLLGFGGQEGHHDVPFHYIPP